MEFKFELRNIKFSPSLSEETNAFTATVYVNGKKAGTASNHGTGGSTTVHLHLLTREERQAIDEWLKAQPPKVYPPSYNGDTPRSIPMDLEVIADDLFQEWAKAKHGPDAQIKKWCKTKVVIQVEGSKSDEYLTVKKDQGKYTLRLKQALLRKYPGATILNETAAGEVAV